MKTFVKGYENKMKLIQESLLDFLENDTSIEEDFLNLIYNINEQKIQENKYDLKALLHIISKISDNHHRNQNFIFKIERVIKNYQKEIKNYFTNFDIFYIFRKNKRILLYLLNEKIIIPDNQIAWHILSNKYINRFYPQYFFKEFKQFYNDQFNNKILSTIIKTKKYMSTKEKMAKMIINFVKLF